MTGFYGIERRNVSELELVIAGGGAAGLSAALYASLLDIKYLIFDAEEGGGLMNLAKTVENLPGTAGKRGPQIAQGLLAQLAEAGGTLRTYEPVIGVETLDATPSGEQPGFLVRTLRSECRPKTLIIATGLELVGFEQAFGVAGERRLLGKGVSYCAECDGPLFRGKRVMVVGSPFDAFLLKRVASEVFYLGPVPEEYRNQVPVEIVEANDIRCLEGRIDELVGEESLEAVVVGGERIEIDGIFFTKRGSNTAPYQGIGVAVDGEGFIPVDRHGATNILGVFAAGDVTGEPWQVSKSIGQGATAALGVFKHLTGQEMRNLGWALEDEWKR